MAGCGVLSCCVSPGVCTSLFIRHVLACGTSLVTRIVSSTGRMSDDLMMWCKFSSSKNFVSGGDRSCSAMLKYTHCHD